MAAPFDCTVVTPQQELLSQQVTYASLPAWDGQVGVMDRRSPLVVQLGYGRLRLTLHDGSQQDYFVGGGFAQMKDNRLTILTDEATAPDQLDAEAAKATLQQVHSESAAGEAQIEKRQRQADRARAIVQLAKSQG
jgi:F-type H+-transporting ATPase subunit epsilon